MKVLGLEPGTYGLKDRCSQSSSDCKDSAYEEQDKSSAISSANLLQKYPDLRQVIKAWPKPPEKGRANDGQDWQKNL